MEPVRRAVIDVGTNSVKLLVADVSGRDIQPVHETSRQTRLGQGFYQTRRLGASPMANTAKAVADFAGQAREQQAAQIRVIATSAARDAVNADELVAAIEQAAGLKVEIISGEQEADWVFQGVTTDARLAAVRLLLLDVGGGSTEFILGRGAHQHFRHSFPLGTVRLLELLPHSEPPNAGELAACRDWLQTFLREEVEPKLGPGLRREMQTGGGAALELVGTGGTASVLAGMEAGLASFDRERLEATRLSLERLHWHTEKLWSLPLEERKQIVGLPKNRADVILTGAAIYEAVMEGFRFAKLRISTRGLRFAAIMQ